jgi:hypothetical protein
MTSEHGGKVDRGPLSESIYTACSTHLNMGLACTLSITREYMEHGGRLSANCALTMYYLPVYPPYSDYNYGLWPPSPLFSPRYTPSLLPPSRYSLPSTLPKDKITAVRGNYFPGGCFLLVYEGDYEITRACVNIHSKKKKDTWLLEIFSFYAKKSQNFRSLQRKVLPVYMPRFFFNPKVKLGFFESCITVIYSNFVAKSHKILFKAKSLNWRL